VSAGLAHPLTGSVTPEVSRMTEHRPPMAIPSPTTPPPPPAPPVRGRRALLWRRLTEAVVAGHRAAVPF